MPSAGDPWRRELAYYGFTDYDDDDPMLLLDTKGAASAAIWDEIEYQLLLAEIDEWISQMQALRRAEESHRSTSPE